MFYHGFGQVILAQVETGQRKIRKWKTALIYKTLTDKNISWTLLPKSVLCLECFIYMQRVIQTSLYVIYSYIIRNIMFCTLPIKSLHSFSSTSSSSLSGFKYTVIGRDHSFCTSWVQIINTSIFLKYLTKEAYCYYYMYESFLVQAPQIAIRRTMTITV